jgi:hypothetical protein
MGENLSPVIRCFDGMNGDIYIVSKNLPRCRKKTPSSHGLRAQKIRLGSISPL